MCVCVCVCVVVWLNYKNTFCLYNFIKILLSFLVSVTHTHTHTHTYIYIYIICVCVCVCVWLSSRRSFKHVWLNNKDTFCLYNFIKIPSGFLIDKCLAFRLELMDELTKIVPSAFGPFMGHHQGLLACVKSVFKRIFKEFFRVFL